MGLDFNSLYNNTYCKHCFMYSDTFEVICCSLCQFVSFTWACMNFVLVCSVQRKSFYSVQHSLVLCLLLLYSSNTVQAALSLSVLTAGHLMTLAKLMVADVEALKNLGI